MTPTVYQACVRFFVHMISFNFCNILIRWMVTLPLDRGENWGSERLNIMPKVAQLVNARVGFESRAVCLWSLCSFYYIMLWIICETWTRNCQPIKPFFHLIWNDGLEKGTIKRTEVTEQRWLSVFGVFRRRWGHGVWDKRCLWKLNTCEGKEQTYLGRRSKTGMQAW